MKNFEQWNGFKGNRWKEKIDVRNFIGMNYTPYDGDASFLEGPTEATNKLWGKLQALQKEERAKGGVLDMETEVVTSLTAYGPGYIDEETKDLEKVVGLQTDKPLKRAFMPYGGIKMAEQACETYGYKVSDKIKDVFHNYEFKTHPQVFHVALVGVEAVLDQHRRRHRPFQHVEGRGFHDGGGPHRDPRCPHRLQDALRRGISAAGFHRCLYHRFRKQHISFITE